MSNFSEVVSSLNENQRKALLAPESDVLQILAGPGTGKTRVITARVAYLLLEKRLPPEDVIVTTFTKKAANEMKERLSSLLEGAHPRIDLQKLFIGTFHSVCVKVLRVYGKKIGLDTRFKIADDTDSKQMIKRVLQDKFGDAIKVNKKDIAEYQTFISGCKSKAYLPKEVPPDTDDNAFHDHIEVYAEYQHALQVNNLIDFDDCLLHTYNLLKAHPECLLHIKHVLVDEFQDTNKVQLELMYFFARHADDHVTVVGDPDQSIYGFRHAEATNFFRMKEHYEKKGLVVKQVALNENYRSTPKILKLAEILMETKQKAKRIPKQLKSHAKEDTPVYFDMFDDNVEEAKSIAYDITQVAGKTGSYKYSDVAIIIRAAFLSRVLEQELIHCNIPYVIVHGHSFWELREVKTMVDLLRVIASNVDWLGYSRTLETFVPGLGAKSLKKIETDYVNASRDGEPGNVYKILKEVMRGDTPGFGVKIRNGLKKYLKMIHTARHIMKDAEDNLPKAMELMFDHVVKTMDLVKMMVELKTKRDDNTENEVKQNLEELRNQLVSFNSSQEELDGEYGGGDRVSIEFLNQFLDSIYLYEQNHYKQSEEKDEGEGKVTVTTIHGSKGLEWPVVFVPALADGILPSRYVLAEDVKKQDPKMDEELRCLYVAVTRAKQHLFLSCFKERQGGSWWSEESVNEVSQFLRGRPMRNMKKRGYEHVKAVSEAYSRLVSTQHQTKYEYRSRNAKEIVKEQKLFSHIPDANPVGFVSAKKLVDKKAMWNVQKAPEKLMRQREAAKAEASSSVKPYIISSVKSLRDEPGAESLSVKPEPKEELSLPVKRELPQLTRKVKKRLGTGRLRSLNR